MHLTNDGCYGYKLENINNSIFILINKNCLFFLFDFLFLIQNIKKILNFFEIKMSREKKSKIKQETIFGWFPHEEEKPRRSPVDVYMNLGSRHPKEESFIGRFFSK